MRRHRIIDKTVHQVTDFASVQDFLAVESVPPGISTVRYNDLPIDMLVSPADSDTTIFFFHGAIEPHFTLPVLSGLGISGGLNANRVFISDPSLVLDETMQLSWYAGNIQQPDLQERLLLLLNKVASDLKSTRTIFFGGSGGGFAALFFAHHFPNSLALVFNPQTSIAKYSERAVRDFTEKAFKIPGEKPDPTNHLPGAVTHDLCELYAKPTRAIVAYLQNKNDDAHVRSHLEPFSDAIHNDTEFLTLIEPWRQGHAPPPKDLLVQLLNATAGSDNWSRCLEEMGFLNGSHCR